MTDIVFMFEVHQPYRLRKDIPISIIRRALEGRLSLAELNDVLFDNSLNEYIIRKAFENCYKPATRILIEESLKLREIGKFFRFSLSVSGVFIEQSKKWVPDLIEIFREVANENIAEFIDQTYYHSLASLLPDNDELIEQLNMHRGLIKDITGKEPIVVENTEFIYNNNIACLMERLGYKVVLTEGVNKILGWRSPNYVYRPWNCEIRVLTRNYRLSDDLGFRFSDKKWDQYPLTADKYAAWITLTPGDVIFIAMDYETFGEHHPPETGIHDFLKWLPHELTKYPNISVEFPSITAFKYPIRDVYDVPPWMTISWADERDLSAWLGNDFQKLAFEIYTSLEPYIKAIGGEVLRLWRLLGTTDHYYYMATKPGSLGEVHMYFSPYKSLPQAFKTLIDALDILVNYVVSEISSNPLKYVKRIKLPRDKAFYFYLSYNAPTGISARSLEELTSALQIVPSESIAFHIRRGDLAQWIKTMFYLEDLSNALNELGKYDLSPSKLKRKAIEVIKAYLD
ncbi:MAG: alpha-amylase [Thermoprotei archaeon]|nr:MAG: alpha-amylase [Thermoprotei archaeon]